MAISLAHGAAELNDDYQRLLAKGRAQIADGETQQEGLGVHYKAACTSLGSNPNLARNSFLSIAWISLFQQAGKDISS